MKIKKQETKLKRQSLILLGVTAAIFLCGCSLAVPEAEEEGGKDRLIGAFITPEHLDLFDMEGYLNDHASLLTEGKTVTVDSTAGYENKLYAEIDKNGSGKTSEWTVTFRDIEGIRFFAPQWEDENGEKGRDFICDEEVSDRHLDMNVSDTGEEISLSGTIYFVPGQSDEDIFYYTNPVYQQADGSIYLVSGNGLSTSGNSAEGVNMTMTLGDEITITENKRSQTEKTRVEVSMAVMNRPVKITLCQMSREHQVLKKKEYLPGTMPESLNAEQAAAYILVETQKQDPEGKMIVTRTAADRKEDEETVLETWYALENGMLARQDTTVNWQ